MEAEATEEAAETCCDEAPAKKARLAANCQSAKQALSGQLSLCKSVSHGTECKFSDKCKYSHDLEAYLASKPADLGDQCPNVLATGGVCKYGIMCRFASGHKSDTSVETIIDKMAFRTDDLRKKRIDFPRSAAFLKTLSATKKSVDDRDLLDVESSKESYPFGERKRIDLSDKLYLAPLTTVGNLPFRRICKEYGVDVTCSEMAMSTNLLQGQMSEWALLKRHPSEDIFGIQVCGAFTDTMTRTAELIDEYVDCDFVDINMGCPIDLVYNKGMGSGLMERNGRMKEIITGMASVMKNKSLTVKMRMGVHDGKQIAHKLIPKVAEWGATAVTIHGRSRQQRYTKEADWSYITQCVQAAKDIPEASIRPSIIGNGDILSWEDYEANRQATGVDSVMVARGALVKPWIFTEIKERRHWDISSSERFDMLKKYTQYALEHFGTDTEGVEKTRRFLLEWLSFLCRYVPVGLLEHVPQKINHRPPPYYGRDELETLMASDQACDWVTITERLLGKAPEGFKFQAKHKSNSYGVTAADRQQRQ